MKSLLCDTLVVGGLVLLTIGLWGMSPTWALVVLGGLLFGLGVWGAMRG